MLNLLDAITSAGEKFNSSEIYQCPLKKYLFSAQRTRISFSEYPWGVLKCQSLRGQKLKKIFGVTSEEAEAEVKKTINEILLNGM